MNTLVLSESVYLHIKPPFDRFFIIKWAITWNEIMIFHENYAKNRTLTTFLWIFEKMFAPSLRTQPDNHRFIFLCFRFFLFSMKPLDWVHFQLWIQLVSRQTLLWFNWVHLLYLTSCTVSFEMFVCVEKPRNSKRTHLFFHDEIF